MTEMFDETLVNMTSDGRFSDDTCRIEYSLRVKETVRCSECAHYEDETPYTGMCMLPDGDGDYARWMAEPDGFCSWGAKRE